MLIWSVIQSAIRAHGICALVTQVDVQGSSPREAGARMVVMPDGTFSGTIGGGALEWRALAKAQAALRRGETAPGLTRHALGPELGQCCGGSVRLMIEVWKSGRLDEAASLTRAESTGVFHTRSIVGDSAVIRTILEGGRAAGDEQIIWESPSVLIEAFGQKRNAVYLFGAGHVGRAMMLALAPLPFDVTWIDQRQDAFPKAVPGNVSKIASSDPAGQLDNAPDGALVLVMTHSHALDLDVVQRALKADRFGYVGVIGSDTKKSRFISQMTKAGLPQDQIEKLVCPIGVAGIASKQPAAIAASVTAELLICVQLVQNAQKTGANSSLAGQTDQRATRRGHGR